MSRPKLALVPLLLLGWVATVASLPAAAEPTAGFMVQVDPGASDIALALPMPVVTGADAETGRQIWAVVKKDLEMTGYFRIIDPDAYIEQGKGVEPGQFDYADWRALKASALAKIRIVPNEGGIRGDVFVYDVNGGSKLDAKGFVGKTTEARYVGHHIADEILLALTGERGFFGTQIVAVGQKSGKKEIYMMDIDGEGLRSVTNNGTINLSPAWAPSKDRIAFTSYKRDNADLYVKNLSTGVLTAISAKQGVDSGAAFSPDGKKLALMRSSNGDSDIFIIDSSSGADLQQLTKSPGIDASPNWSPDGKKIAFASERSGGLQIYVQDVASGSANRVTFQGANNSDPVFSPDGSRIAFVGRNGNFDVFVVDVDGRNMVRVTQDQGDNEDPSWSPDGKYLMFSSTRAGKSQLYISTADGRHQTAITSSGGWLQPSWSP